MATQVSPCEKNMIMWKESILRLGFHFIFYILYFVSNNIHSVILFKILNNMTLNTRQIYNI